jgi:N-acetylglucosamine-6-sulfatase
MRVLSAIAALALTLVALPGSLAQTAALTVTVKTSSSVSLSWAGWDTTGAVRLELYRNGALIVTWRAAGQKVAHTDSAVTWGTTYAYFLRLVRANGTAKDTNTVWVTTNTPERWNVVLIVTDDQRADTLQYMPFVHQLLVQRGVTFTNAFAATPQCCPSRSGILTGLHAHHHGVLSNRLGARYFLDASTIGTWLQGTGYRTALIGKYLNGYTGSSCAKLYGQCFVNRAGMHPWPYQPPGWSDWRVFRTTDVWNYTLVENGSEVVYGTAPEEYSTRLLAAHAVDFIATTPLGRPFFVLFAPFAPHQPAQYEAQDEGLFAALPPWRPPSYNEADVSDKPAWVRTLPPLAVMASADLDGLRVKQLRSLQSIDRAVKTIYEAVAATGSLDSTVFIFTSDNGQSWGEHRWTAKMCPYDECTKIPLVIRVPGAAPRTDAHLVSLIDLAPSLAAWTGAVHPRVDGISLAKLVMNKDVAWRDAVLIEMLDGESGQQAILHSAIRTAQYFYAAYANGDREFYLVKSDPYFLTNRVADSAYTEVIATLKARLKALAKP